MNWDISIGRGKQWYGRLLQRIGQKLARRGLVLDGEAVEYAGRLQARYGTLKHQVQWNSASMHLARETLSTKKPLSL